MDLSEIRVGDELTYMPDPGSIEEELRDLPVTVVDHPDDDDDDPFVKVSLTLWVRADELRKD